MYLYLLQVWSAPLQIAIATAWLVFILGPSALAGTTLPLILLPSISPVPNSIVGLGIMVLLIPFNIWLARTQGKLQKQIMKIKDSRAKRMNEILNGIRVVKVVLNFFLLPFSLSLSLTWLLYQFFVWETSMSASVLEIRTAELKLLRHSAYLRV